jgi:hypothetical protein
MAAGLIAVERESVTGSFEERAKHVTDQIILTGQEYRPDFLGVTKLLVEAGADIDAKIKLSDEFFMSFGAGINTIEERKRVFSRYDNKTPLECARILGNTEVAVYLENLIATR